MSVIDLPRIVPAGDAALLVVLGDVVSLEINARVRALAQVIESRAFPGVRDITVANATLLVHYDPLMLSFEDTQALILELAKEIRVSSLPEGRLFEIPTVFGGAYGPDLPWVAQYVKMSVEEFLRVYTAGTYTVFMLGYLPGNPYLGGLPRELAVPRLESPRQRVPAGTVIIANQTNIHSFTSPGGWRWLGRTPLRLFDPAADPPVYLQDGDRVRFIPISEEEYLRMGGEKAE